MKYKTILFDMDGTVLYTLPDLCDSVNYSLAQFGYAPITIEQTRRYVGNASRRLIEQAAPGADSETVDRILDFYKPWYAAHCSVKTRPYDGIPELLRRLHDAGHRLAIVSNKPDESVKELAEKFFPGVLETAAGESAGVRRKPWPDTAEAALRFMGEGKDSAVYVGDSEVDIQTARNCSGASSARAWMHRTSSKPSIAQVSRRKPMRLSRLSSSVSSMSGQAIFSARPGKPAPVPTSITRLPRKSAMPSSAAQSRKCRRATSSSPLIAVRFITAFIFSRCSKYMR